MNLEYPYEMVAMAAPTIDASYAQCREEAGHPLSVFVRVPAHGGDVYEITP
jgi:hypothetical protein